LLNGALARDRLRESRRLFVTNYDAKRDLATSIHGYETLGMATDRSRIRGSKPRASNSHHFQTREGVTPADKEGVGGRKKEDANLKKKNDLGTCRSDLGGKKKGPLFRPAMRKDGTYSSKNA